MERRKRGSISKAASAPAPPKVVPILAGLLERAAARGDADGGGTAAPAFRGRTRPEISVRRYAERIYRYAGCSPACFVVAHVYLDRLARRREDDDDDEEAPTAAAAVCVDSYSVHRLLITSVMVASKFMDDIAVVCWCVAGACMQTLQQRLLRARGRRGGGGDERPGAGAPLRAALPPQRQAGDLCRLLRRARGRGDDGGGQQPPAATIAVDGGGASGRRRPQIGPHQGCSRSCTTDHPMTVTDEITDTNQN